MWSIELVNICKAFEDKSVINDINLKIEEGEFVSLLGPSGCGKSTTLKIISGLLEPERGDILLNGASVLNIPVEKRGAVIVFQDFLLFPHMNIEDNIAFGLKMSGVEKNKRISKVKEMIELVQLNGLEKKYPSEISGGQKQRVALARALAISPKVLLLDEPFSSLDQRLREDMRQFVFELQKKLRITTILVTHDKEEALMLSDKIAVMLVGNIVQYGTPDEIYNRPASKEVADFFGDNNYIEGELSGGVFKSKLGDFNINNNVSGKLVAMIRPEGIKILDKEDSLRGIVIKKKYAGDRVYYSLLVNDVELKCIGNSKSILSVGDEVSIGIDFSNAVFYSK
jgi:ABC-type Fe3+/spermidine/putrescine transport system ATPase subunit